MILGPWGGRRMATLSQLGLALQGLTIAWLAARSRAHETLRAA
ncbi:MAG: hypothetical protein ACXW05_13335 [Gemmatirosa sp.]